MSTCISIQGEYGEHVASEDFTCRRCYVFDEDGALARIAELEAALASTPSPAQPTDQAAVEFLTSALAETDADEANGGAGWDVEVDARTVLKLLAPSPVQGADDRLAQDTWVQRSSPSTVVIRRGLKIIASFIDDGEVQRIAHELLAVSPLPHTGSGDQLAQAEAAIAAAHAACPDCNGHGWIRTAIDDAMPCDNPMHAALATYQQSPHAALNEVRAGALLDAVKMLEAEAEDDPHGRGEGLQAGADILEQIVAELRAQPGATG